MTATESDLTRLEEFAGRMVGVLNGGMLSLSLSLAYQSGLLDTLATLPPSTSTEVAAAAGLQERYVRENLGALTTGGVVEHQEANDTYFLPPEHAHVFADRPIARTDHRDVPPFDHDQSPMSARRMALVAE